VTTRVAERRLTDVAPLHQGKTYFEPLPIPGDWSRDEFPMLAHEHAPPGGIRYLRECVSDYLQRRGHRMIDANDLVITNGATHGTFVVFNSILEPGDEVVVLSPQWLFSVGLVHAARGVAVEVPVFLELAADATFDIVSAIEAAITPRTRALYFNTPNNPTGVSLTPSTQIDLVRLARRHGLWIVADNTYENYDFTKHGFLDIATLDDAAERTFSVYTLSKTFAIPGYRIGFVAAPPGWADALRIADQYSAYSLSTISQRAGVIALAMSDEALDERRELAAAAWRTTHRELIVPHTFVEGGLYTFLDLSDCSDDTDTFVNRCVDSGVTLAPGIAFGRHHAGYVRLCFTAVGPQRLGRALDTINEIYQKA
jgi:aspartate aminotransferase/N-succinyldiaminopimelate aminotransferase